MSHAEVVEAWFRETIATGEIARHTEAYNQAFVAKADLVARLDEAGRDDAKDDHAAVVGVWAQQQMLTGELGRHAPCNAQAVAASADLVERLNTRAASASATTPAAGKARKA